MENIIPFFKQYTLQSVTKMKSFKMFCQIARLVEARKHLTGSGIKRIRAFKLKMNQKTIGLA